MIVLGLRIARLFLACLVILPAIFGGTAAVARAAPSLSLPVCVAQVTPGSTPATIFAGNAAGFDCGEDQYRHGPGDYWALSAPIAARDGTGDLNVRVLSLWQNALTLHALYADGRMATIHADSRAVTRHVQLGAILNFDLPTRDVPVVRLLWRIDGAANVRGILLGQMLVSPLAVERSNVGMAALYGGCAGLVIALLISNFAIWGALRYRLQLAYCAMVAALLIYTVSSSGALAWVWPGIDNNDRLRINYLMLGLAAASALVFARAFFESRVFGRTMTLATNAAVILLITVGVLFWPLSYIDVALADTLYTWALAIGLSMIVPILFEAWRRKSDYLWMFAIAWAAPLALSMTRILAALHLVPGGFWLDNSTVLALGYEAMMSSLAISYRVWKLNRERDEARDNETIARRLADTEPLTGLLNRRSFLTQAIGRPGPQTLHIIDIDHFKQINETLGHDGGDEVLRAYARALRIVAPAGALVARIGGEEFAILTHADTPVDPDTVLARLRAAQMPFDVGVTSSIGSCTGPLTSDVDWKKLYHHADRALFDAKAAGRDRSRHARPLGAVA